MYVYTLTRGKNFAHNIFLQRDRKFDKACLISGVWWLHLYPTLTSREVLLLALSHYCCRTTPIKLLIHKGNVRRRRRRRYRRGILPSLQCPPSSSILSRGWIEYIFGRCGEWPTMFFPIQLCHGSIVVRDNPFGCYTGASLMWWLPFVYLWWCVDTLLYTIFHFMGLFICIIISWSRPPHTNAPSSYPTLHAIKQHN